MQAYEKIGAFYLGKIYDPETQTLCPDLVLYDSKDLATHAVIIGMTGSGKTGLGIGLLEEAMIDRIPVIAVDPKGDLTNLALTFPNLAPEDFRTWVNPRAAAKKGVSQDDFAASEARRWADGLGEWDQDSERIQRLRSAAQLTVYTPGSSAGCPVRMLRTFSAPGADVRNDPDLFSERVEATATSLLSLLGLKADPLTSKEHILVANIFKEAWRKGQSLDIGGLIQSIQRPSFKRIGIMDLETFYPSKDRFELAMRFNNLLAAPGFEMWMKGQALDIDQLLHTPTGRPRASIFTISHLNDAQRMFFVSMLLTQILGWIRTQPGTTSLRAVFYMDEIFGYFPPVQNPPSKTPLLRLLKQARAFGLGIVLSTQNPVDLDYRGLSNTGTWFIGRLQTERDKERVLSGLSQGSTGARIPLDRLGRMISSLGKRTFFMHNVHENAPVTFQSRWTLSYLAGPMTRDQIKQLKADTVNLTDKGKAQAKPAPPAVSTESAYGMKMPSLPPQIPHYFLQGSGIGHETAYIPSILTDMEIHYHSARYKVNVLKKSAMAAQIQDGAIAVQWDDAVELPNLSGRLVKEPMPEARFFDLPSQAFKSANYKQWKKELLRWVKANRPLTLLQSKRLKINSQPGEAEGAFRGRLTLAMHEKRDIVIEKLRQKYDRRFTTLQNRLLRAQHAISREREQVEGRKMDTMVSFGTAILGAFLGRKAVSGRSASRMGGAIRSAGRLQKEKMDVVRAKEKVASIQKEIEVVEDRLRKEIDRIADEFDVETEELASVKIAPKLSDISLRVFGLGWLPYRKNESGRLVPDWA